MGSGRGEGLGWEPPGPRSCRPNPWGLDRHRRVATDSLSNDVHAVGLGGKHRPSPSHAILHAHTCLYHAIPHAHTFGRSSITTHVSTTCRSQRAMFSCFFLRPASTVHGARSVAAGCRNVSGGRLHRTLTMKPPAMVATAGVSAHLP